MKHEQNWIGSIAATRAFICTMNGSGTGTAQEDFWDLSFGLVDCMDADTGRVIVLDAFKT